MLTPIILFSLSLPHLLVHAASIPQKRDSMMARLGNRLKSFMVPVEELIVTEVMKNSPSRTGDDSSSNKELYSLPVEVRTETIPKVVDQDSVTFGREEEEELYPSDATDYRSRQGYYFLGSLDSETPSDAIKGPSHFLLFDSTPKAKGNHQLRVKAGEPIFLLPSCHDETAQGLVWHLAKDASGLIGYVPLEYIHPPVQRKARILTPPAPKITGFPLPFAPTPVLPRGSSRNGSDYYWHSPPIQSPPSIHQVRCGSSGPVGYILAANDRSTRFAYVKDGALRTQMVDIRSLVQIASTSPSGPAPKTPPTLTSRVRTSPTRRDSPSTKLEQSSEFLRMDMPSDYIKPLRRDSSIPHYSSSRSNRDTPSPLSLPRMPGVSSAEGGQRMTREFSHRSLASPGSFTSSGEEDGALPGQFCPSRESDYEPEGVPAQVILSHFLPTDIDLENPSQRFRSMTLPGSLSSFTKSGTSSLSNSTQPRLSYKSRRESKADIHRIITEGMPASLMGSQNMSRRPSALRFPSNSGTSHEKRTSS